MKNLLGFLGIGLLSPFLAAKCAYLLLRELTGLVLEGALGGTWEAFLKAVK